MKKLGLLMAFLLMFQVIAFGETAESSTQEVVKQEQTSISYDEAVNLLLEKNQELQTLRDKIEIQKVIIEEVDNESSRLKDFMFENEDKINERATHVYVDPVTSRSTLNTMQRTLDDRTFDLKQEVLDFYVKYVKQSNSIELLEESLNVAQNEYDQKNLELKVGQIIENDLRSYELALQTAKNNLDSAKRDLDLMLIDFNYLITNDLESAYTPNTSNLESVMVPQYIDINTIDLERVKEVNLENSNELLNLQENNEKYEQMKKVERLDPSTVSAYENYNSNIEDNEFEINKKSKEIRYQVNIDYNNLKSAFIDIQLMKNKIEMVQNTLENTKLMADNGMATNLDVMKVQQNLTSAENALTDALNEFYKAYRDFLRFY